VDYVLLKLIEHGFIVDIVWNDGGNRIVRLIVKPVKP